MVLGGVHKNSLIDYPGKVACVLFLSGCNFDCPYCHNPDLATGCADCPAFFKEKANLFDFLEKRRGFLDGVVISGGEPTLQKDLADLCAALKEMDYPVKIDTNGSRPGVLQDLLDADLVDYIAMDIKTDPFRYPPFVGRDIDPRNILESIRIIRGSSLPHEFRTTCIRPLVSDEIIETIAMLIQGADLYVLQQFQDTSVLHPEFFQVGDCRFEKADLKRFKGIARRWVKRCEVRGE